MNQKVHFTAVSFLVVLFTGIILKIYHLPGAGIAITAGVFLFVVVYLPWLVVSWIKQFKNESKGRMLNMVYLVIPAVLVLTFGVLAKIMHWPGAQYGLWGGIGFIMTLLLITLVINPALSNRIPMIWILIVIIIFGSFSFNTIRFGNVRPLTEAEKLTTKTFSEAYNVFRAECHSWISGLDEQKDSLESMTLYLQLKELHVRVSLADSFLNELSIKISDIPDEGKGDPESATEQPRNLYAACLTDSGGLSLVNRSFSDITHFYNSSGFLSPEQKDIITKTLVYPFSKYYGASLPIEFGIHEYEKAEILNLLNLWKLKLWETEYRYILYLYIN